MRTLTGGVMESTTRRATSDGTGGGDPLAEPAPPRWEHFRHESDIGIRGLGGSVEQAFEQAGLALSAAICDLDAIRQERLETVSCKACSLEMLFLEWIDTIIFSIATRKMLFSDYRVRIDACRLSADMWGEPINWQRHAPVVEPKGATLTELSVTRTAGGLWRAQCVVDV